MTSPIAYRAELPVPVDSGLAALVRHTSDHIPVMRPKLPSSAEIQPYLQVIDERQWYTNWGPLVTQLEQQLSRYLGVERNCVVTTANATVGLTAALLALDVPAGSFCLMPSWTFPATPHAARAAGLEPWLHDIDRRTWALDPDAVLRSLPGIREKVGAVIVVSPFGAPLDLAAWEAFQEKSGIPVVIDAAASFDTVAASRLLSVVSLHATKILGAGEGGFIATLDDRLSARVKACCNFGFQGTRDAMCTALNAKMSEYHAAVGLASFAKWDQIRAQHAQIAEWYCAAVAASGADVAVQPGYGTGWVGSTTSVSMPAGSMAAVAGLLSAVGVETRSWWGPGCHAQPAFSSCPRGPLPVTDELGARVLGLPHYPEMRKSDVDAVVEAVAEAVSSRSSQSCQLA